MQRQILLIATLALLGSTLMSAPVAAKPIDKDRFHEAYDLVHKDFCGASGLTVSDKGTRDVSFSVNSHGPNGIAYYREHALERGTVTDLATGNWITFQLVVNSKDLHVVDNGDGTLTITTFGTGSFSVYGSDGKALGRDPGQFRGLILIDHGGTPNDVSDDEFIRELAVLKESTGRTDDICGAMLRGLGVNTS